MSIVPDASALLAVAFKDEDATFAGAVLDAIQQEGAVVPAVFWFEIRNVLVLSERRGRITPIQTHTFLAELGAQPIEIEPLPPEAAVLNLARQHNLTVFDASYLELSQRKRGRLATFDKALVRAATGSGVALFTA